ncbi:hypothetical protein [Magnetovibrio sp.]|uniref:hypothetical protein n=1 Tax=Magnetovibrio sp. TaxID=2024836 RepID=UPI002F95997D
MAPLDRALVTREQQLQEALDALIAQHGAQSETVALIRGRLDDVRKDLAASQVDLTGNESHTGSIVESWGAPKCKDSALMFVILGGVLIFAFGGMSTLFVLMLAAKW